MSFSKETKQELCNAPVFTQAQKIAMVYGMVLFSRVFTVSGIACSTESRPAAMLYSEQLSALTNTIVEMSVKLTHRGGENHVYSLSIPDREDCGKIYDFFGHTPQQPSLRINRANIDGDDCIGYFLRGVFLTCGSVTSPEKDYHLEFVVPHKRLAQDLAKLLSEIREMEAQPKTVQRKGSYVVYLKESNVITDVLTYMGAQMAALSMIQSSIVKSIRNSANRRRNSETANINKTAGAAARQLHAIEVIQKKRGLESLPDDLREVAQIRLDFPEYNLREIGAALREPISRSGVNHRIQRILEMAEELERK